MPRVLFVTHSWLPDFDAGVRHAAILARYLPEAGWDPIILTSGVTRDDAAADAPAPDPLQEAADLPSLRAAATLPCVRVPFVPRDNLLVRWQAALATRGPDESTGRAGLLARTALDATYPLYGEFPDRFRGWVAPAVAAGLSAIRQFGAGAVVSLSQPDSAHIAAGRMARAAGLPWVPLFGALGAFRTARAPGRTLFQRLEQRELARRWLRGAFAGGAASPEMAAYLEQRFALAVDSFVVPFDPAERRLPPRRVAGSPLRLVHVGRLAPGARVDLLVDALDLLLAEEPALASSLEVEFVGSGAEARLQALLQDRPAATLCRLTPRVSPAAAVARQREADALLLFAADDPLSRYPSTLFEQLNARRPTIAVAEDGSFVARLLRETGAGASAPTMIALMTLLRAASAELRGTGELAFRGDEGVIGRYGGPEQARRLAGMLDVGSAGRFGTWQRG